MRTVDRTIVTPHADIRVTDTGGAGLPLLMLHGSGASRRVFEHQLSSQLAERHRLIALDLPGHGESSDARDPSWGYSLPGFADIVADVLHALQIERVAAFGWSLGGHIAVELMHRHPGVAGVVLTGAPPLARGPIAMLRGFHANWDMLLASKEKFTQRDIERWAELCYGNAASSALIADIQRTDGRVRAVFSRSMMRGEGADQKRTVEDARVPVAIIDGERDPIIRHSYAAGLDIPTLWDGHVHVLPGASHAAFRDAPDRFNALLMRFAADAVSWRDLAEVETARRA
jgi:pimeloyl-ACP methyl ester carboxylesterase